LKEKRVKDDTMATTKADPYQDPSYHLPHHESHAVFENRTVEDADLAPETQDGIPDGIPEDTKEEGSGQIESFVHGQVDDLLKRTHAQAKREQQAGTAGAGRK
jgi:hypothetical protein